jgi:hypothetical protein
MEETELPKAATSAVACPQCRLSHQLDIIKFHALGDKSREAPRLVLREMQVVRGDGVLTTGEANCEPARASTEAGLAVDEGREGV